MHEGVASISEISWRIKCVTTGPEKQRVDYAEWTSIGNFLRLGSSETGYFTFQPRHFISWSHLHMWVEWKIFHSFLNHTKEWKITCRQCSRSSGQSLELLLVHRPSIPNRLIHSKSVAIIQAITFPVDSLFDFDLHVTFPRGVLRWLT